MEHFITHNGDLDFFRVAGVWHETGKVQQWLERVLECAMPATVDSACIAGLVDLHRTAGCWGLSVRYAHQCGLRTALGPDEEDAPPSYAAYERCGRHFERALDALLSESPDASDALTLRAMDDTHRARITRDVMASLEKAGPGDYFGLLHDEEASMLPDFVRATVDAFFDNDLMHTMRLVLGNSKGSFGLCITSSMVGSTAPRCRLIYIPRLKPLASFSCQN